MATSLKDNKNYDLVVIGAGPGGYVAAIRGAQNGLKVAIVERDKKLGGTCLLRGCIPTKALLHSADVLSEMRGAADHGIIAENISFDFTKVQKGRKKIIDKSAAGVNYLMKQNKIEVIKGTGKITSATGVKVTAEDGTVTALKAKNIVIATGSVPVDLPFLKRDGKYFVTSDEMLELKAPPKSLIVLGAGAVGVEFASIYSRFGTECTIIEMQPNPLPIEDEEVGKEFAKALKKRGITVRCNTQLKSAEVKGGMVHAIIEKMGPNGESVKQESLEAEILLVAVGRKPVTADLGLEQLGIERDKAGYIAVDRQMRTAVKNIFAIGDIVRTPLLAHVASAEGILAADIAAGKEAHVVPYEQTPSCTYADPEVASVGMTEAAATDAGYLLKIGKYPFSALGKARVMGKSEGFVKIISDAKYGEVLGVHIIGPHATDLIAEACVALRLEATAEELAHTIHAHPTLSEAMLEAAHGAIGQPIHL